MINQDNRYLDYCNNIVEKLSEGEALHISLNRTGYILALNQLIQEYFFSPFSQKENIKITLKRSVDILWSYLMPLDLSDDENSILPAEFEGDNIIINNTISLYEGELQIALLFVKIAILLQDESLLKKANLIGSFSKIKEDRFKDNVISFDLRNGTIGIALLYQTIYFLTNEKLYLDRANYWFEKSENLKGVFLNDNNTFNKQVDQETILAFEAFKNPLDSTTWRRIFFIEFEPFLESIS